MAAECVIPLDLVPKLAVAAAANPKMAAVAASPAAVMAASAQPQPQQLQLVHFVVGSHHQFQFSGVAKADQLQIPGAMAAVTDGATAAKRKKASPRSLSSSTSSSEVMSPAPSPMAAAAPTSEADSRCTICGQNFADNKSAFNAHIKAHLKEKLNNRRARAEKQMQQSKVAAATAPQSTPTGKINNQTAAAVASVATAAALGQVQQQSLAEKAASGSSPGQRKRKKPSTPPPHSPHPTANTPAPTTPRPAPSLATMQRPQSATAVLQKHPLLPPPLIGLPPPPPPPRPQTLQHSLASHHQVMAELAACKPIPPSQQQPQFLTATVSSEPLPPPLPLPAALKQQQAPQVPSTTLAAMSEMANPKKPEVALQNSTSISVVVKQQQEQQRHQQQQQPSQPPTLPLDNLCTPEISDMEEDLMSYEMEMNRIDFHNDLSTILDQLEKDFESPGLMGDFMMDEMPPSQPAAMIDTPPDSDSEVYFQNPISPSAAAATSTLSAELQSLVAAAAAATAADDHASLKSKPPFPIVTSSSSVSSATSSSSEVTPYNGQLDLLGFDRFVRVQSAARPDAAAVSQQRTMESQQQAAASSSPSASGAMNAMTGSGCTVVQSPASLAKVGRLNPQALAVLSQLPSKLFPTGPGADSTRLVNVVKVENATTTNKVSSLAASAASVSTTPSAVTPYTVINIECHQPGKNGEIEKKVLETYRAIETRGEIKLVAVGSTTVVSGEQPRTVAMGNCGGAGTYNYYNHNSQPEPSPMSTCSSSHDSAIDSPMSGMSTDENSVFERQATKKLSYPQSCIQCPEKFSKLSELLEHQITTHQNQEHRCERCGQAFSSHPGLLGHRRTHPECGLVVASSSSRPEQQQLQQSRQKPFSCRSCKRSFTQRGHLNRHEKTHGAETGGKTKGAVATTTAWNDDFTCKVCGKRCKNNAGLARHRAKHLTCAQCAVSFDSKAALQDHLFKRHPESAVITVEKPPPPPPQSEHGDDDDDFESDLRTRSAMETATATRRGDSFLVSCCADEDDDEDQVQISGLAASLGSDGGSSSKGLSPDALGESLVDISDSNFFDFDKDLNDEFYSTADLF